MTIILSVTTMRSTLYITEIQLKKSRTNTYKMRLRPTCERVLPEKGCDDI